MPSLSLLKELEYIKKAKNPSQPPFAKGRV
jgi:hypothetical protein